MKRYPRHRWSWSSFARSSLLEWFWEISGETCTLPARLKAAINKYHALLRNQSRYAQLLRVYNATILTLRCYRHNPSSYSDANGLLLGNIGANTSPILFLSPRIHCGPNGTFKSRRTLGFADMHRMRQRGKCLVFRNGMRGTLATKDVLEKSVHNSWRY